MNWLGLLVPLVYLGILLGSLYTFSHLYRQRKINAQLNLEPYFPAHTARNVYLTLLHQTDSQADLKQVPNSVLIAALLERAIEDIHRIRDIQMRKGPLNTLLQRGVVGEETWQRFLRAEQEMEMELKDVVNEANALATGFGNTIFQTASEMAVNRMTKKQVEQKQATLTKEKADWEAMRESARRELEGGNPSFTTKSEPEKSDLAVQAKEVSAVSAPEKPKMTATVSSDDDAVLVETPAGQDVRPDTPGSVGGNTSGGKTKKKKNKK